MTAPPTKRRPDLLRDDQRCREAFRRGERWAMTQVYRTYLPLVKTIAAHGFGSFKGFFDPIDQEDFIQNVFATAFEERVRLRYNGLDPYVAFLRGLAHNIVRQMLDKRRRFQRVPEQEPEGHQAYEDAFIEREVAALCREFQEQLRTDPVDAEICQRYFIDGWSEERLAAHLEITRYRLRKRIGGIHRRMTKFMEAHGIA